jgi:hypothetical protein
MDRHSLRKGAFHIQWKLPKFIHSTADGQNKLLHNPVVRKISVTIEKAKSFTNSLKHSVRLLSTSAATIRKSNFKMAGMSFY